MKETKQEITLNNLMEEFDKSTHSLLSTISLFSKEQFNTIPFEGSWTAGQVCEHLFKAEAGYPGLLSGSKMPTDRPVDEKMAIVQSVFLDFTAKFQSPEFIIPSDTVKDNAAMLEAFKNNREDVRRVINSIDMSETCTDFALPQMGQLTGYEWICFLTCHSIRHTRQLNNIYAALNKQ
ncbi:MAG TPA: DinB family protein [Chitinophagaceae bacterium]